VIGTTTFSSLNPSPPSHLPPDEPLSSVAGASQAQNQISESNLLRSLFISKILQSFELTFSSDDQSVPTSSLVDFLRVHVSSELSEIISLALEPCSSSSSSTATPFYDRSDPHAPYLAVLFASDVIIIPTMSQSASSKLRRNLCRIDKKNTRSFLSDFLSKALMRMAPRTKNPEFYLEKKGDTTTAEGGGRGGPSQEKNKPMSLLKRVELIESIVLDAQQTIDALMDSFKEDESDRMMSSPSPSPSFR
jgi:hypothetical protein